MTYMSLFWTTTRRLFTPMTWCCDGTEGEKCRHCPGTSQRWTRQLCSRPEPFSSTPWKLKVELKLKKQRTWSSNPLCWGCQCMSFFWAEPMQLFEAETSTYYLGAGRCVVWSISDGYGCWYRLFDQELGGTVVSRPGHHMRCLVEPIPGVLASKI